MTTERHRAGAADLRAALGLPPREPDIPKMRAASTAGLQVVAEMRAMTFDDPADQAYINATAAQIAATLAELDAAIDEYAAAAGEESA